MNEKAARTIFYFMFGSDSATKGQWGIYKYGQIERGDREGSAWRWRVVTAFYALRVVARGGQWTRPSQLA